MKVTLIDHTGALAGSSAGFSSAHYAAALLCFTKNTRLNMSAGGLWDFLEKHYDELLKELEYMANTVPSSWEFCHYTFMVEGVTRAFTHQFVRSRQCSFAQQTMRVLDVSGWDYLTGPTIENNPRLKASYQTTMQEIDMEYCAQIANGAAIEDARGLLPTNILTNIVMSCNMRTFVELVRKRSSSRTQGEYRDVLKAMKVAVREVHPWIDIFIDRTFEKAAKELDEQIRELEVSDKQKTAMIKLIDQMRAQS